MLPYTAGGFIYIATVTVIPNLLESTSGTTLSKWNSLFEVSAIAFGIGLMALVSHLE